jgi:hypothetical protein
MSSDSPAWLPISRGTVKGLAVSVVFAGLELSICELASEGVVSKASDPPELMGFSEVESCVASKLERLANGMGCGRGGDPRGREGEGMLVWGVGK